MNPFEQNLDRQPANNVPLSPLSFLPRTAALFPESTAVVHGNSSYSWSEAYARCRRLASALAKLGVSKGDVVAVMAPNTPPMWEAHHGVPMLGAVLNALNVRLDAQAIAFILQHGDAKVLITDSEYHETIAKSLERLGRDDLKVIDVQDPQGPGGRPLGAMEYEDFLASGDPDFHWSLPDDEWNAIALNYTSGTTGTTLAQ